MEDKSVPGYLFSREDTFFRSHVLFETFPLRHAMAHVTQPPLPNKAGFSTDSMRKRSLAYMRHEHFCCYCRHATVTGLAMPSCRLKTSPPRCDRTRRQEQAWFGGQAHPSHSAT